MNSDNIFGGKITVIGGDPKQILPVVPRVPPAAVLDVCLKHSSIWNNFHQMQLKEFMRTNANEQDFSRWLIQLGS